MKIAVICANGKSRKLIVKEAVSRGLDVTAVVREENQSAAQKGDPKDLFDLTVEDLEGFDVVIDAFGAWTEDTLPLHSTSLKKLCDLLSGSSTRLLVVGGAGSLYVNKDIRWIDFPMLSNPLLLPWLRLWENFVKEMMYNGPTSVPQEISKPKAKKTGKYILGGEELILNSKGESVISYADYAIAMIDRSSQRQSYPRKNQRCV